MSKKEKSKLDNSLDIIEKQFGKGLMVNLEAEKALKLERVSTGCISLDQAIGGGLPRGRIIEIFGQSSSGKSSLCLSITKQFQDLGEKVAYLDAEQVYDKHYGQLNGIDHKDLIFAQPEYTEQLFFVLESLIDSEEIGLVIVDSIAAIGPLAEMQGETGDSHMGLQARMVSQAMRRLNAKVNKTKTIIIFVNQMRKTIKTFGFGSPWTTTSGEALKYYASIRMELCRMGTVKKGEESLATQVKVKIPKNKCFAPHKEAKFEIWYDIGLCRITDIINIAIDQGLIQKKTGWFIYGDEKIQGLENLRNKLKEDKELFEKIKNEIYLEK